MSNKERTMVLFDTDIVRFEYRRDARFSFYERHTAGLKRAIALQTLQDLWYGAIRNGWGDVRLAEFTAFLTRYELVIPTKQTARMCGEVRASQERRGKKLSKADAWVVATALTLDCPLASHDRRLADVPGLKLIQAPEDQG